MPVPVSETDGWHWWYSTSVLLRAKEATGGVPPVPPKKRSRQCHPTVFFWMWRLPLGATGRTRPVPLRNSRNTGGVPPVPPDTANRKWLGSIQRKPRSDEFRPREFARVVPCADFFRRPLADRRHLERCSLSLRSRTKNGFIPIEYCRNQTRLRICGPLRQPLRPPPSRLRGSRFLGPPRAAQDGRFGCEDPLQAAAWVVNYCDRVPRLPFPPFANPRVPRVPNSEPRAEVQATIPPKCRDKTE